MLFAHSASYSQASGAKFPGSIPGAHTVHAADSIPRPGTGISWFLIAKRSGARGGKGAGTVFLPDHRRVIS